VDLLQLSYVTYDENHSTWDPRPNMTCSEPGCANPKAAVWLPSLKRVWSNSTSGSRNQDRVDDVGAAAKSCSIVIELAFEPLLHINYGAPTTAYVELELAPANRSLSAALVWFNKTATRLPESIMASFRPKSPSEEQHPNAWELDILGGWTSPYDVGSGSTNQWQHSIWSGARYTRSDGDAGDVTQRGLMVESLDAPLACPIVDGGSGQPGLLGGSTPVGEGVSQAPHLPNSVTGMAFNLLNNMMPISGFNQWYPFGTGEFYQKNDTASRFRFRLYEQEWGMK